MAGEPYNEIVYKAAEKIIAGSGGTSADPTIVAQATAANLNAAVQGPVAHDAVYSGNHIAIGGYATFTRPTAVANGDTVRAWFNTYGAQTVAPITCFAATDGLQNGSMGATFSGTDATVAVAGFPLVGPIIYNGSTWDRQRSITGAIAAGTGNVAVSTAPHSSAAGAITPVVTSAVASSLVLKAGAGNFYGANITTGGTAGYLMLFNATSAPVDGAVTPIKTWVVAANSTVVVGYNPIPIACSTGITLVFSSTGPFTKTASATAFMSGEAV